MSNCDIFHRSQRFNRETDHLRAGIPFNMSRHSTNKTDQLCANLPFNIHRILGMARQQQQHGRGADVISLSTVQGLVDESANWSHHVRSHGILGIRSRPENVAPSRSRSHANTNSTEPFRCTDTTVTRLATSMNASEERNNYDLGKCIDVISVESF